MDSAIPELRGLTREAFSRSIATYLGHAYPSGILPPAVRDRLQWPDGVDMPTLLSSPQFERSTVPGTNSPLFALRLGNHLYPHMKLQLQPWPTSVGYMLSVNTHDQVLGREPAPPDTGAFRLLQQANQRLKEQIELAWERDGLPTFLRYLRDYMTAQEDDYSMREDAPSP